MKYHGITDYNASHLKIESRCIMADWDSFSKRYDDIFLQFPMYVDTLRIMVTLLEDADGKRVLDLGCGTGNVIEAVLSSFPEATVFGVDPSQGMREICSSRFSGDSRVQLADGGALDIPFPDGNFNYVMTNLALHHVPPDSRGQCANEFARVLKSGGKLIYSDTFCEIDGPPDDPERCRDIINKMVGTALFALNQGAYEMMLVMLSAIYAQVKNEGEFLTTAAVWMGTLEAAGFSGFEITGISPEELGYKIISAERA